jgi:hypothetical protein
VSLQLLAYCIRGVEYYSVVVVHRCTEYRRDTGRGMGVRPNWSG